MTEIKITAKKIEFQCKPKKPPTLTVRNDEMTIEISLPSFYFWNAIFCALSDIVKEKEAT